MTAISKHSQLKSLHIPCSDLSSVAPGLLAGAVKKLRTLIVSYGQLTTQQIESILAAITKDSQLKYLSISFNDLSSVEPGLLAAAVRNLETLDVMQGRLTRQQTESIIAAVSEDSQLKDLVLSSNDLSTVEPGLLAVAINKLKNVDMNDSKLTSQQVNMILTQSQVQTSLDSLHIYSVPSVDSDIITQTRRLFELKISDSNQTIKSKLVRVPVPSHFYIYFFL